jgi:hypothetical protein
MRVAIRQYPDLDLNCKLDFDLSDRFFLTYVNMRLPYEIDEGDLKPIRESSDPDWKLIKMASIQDCWEIYQQFSKKEIKAMFRRHLDNHRAILIELKNREETSIVKNRINYSKRHIKLLKKALRR